MIEFRLRLICLLSAAMALPAAAAGGRYPITADEIAAAVSSRGVQVSADQVNLLADAVASVAHPALTVKSIDRLGDQSLVARLECASSDQCLPFIVKLRVNAAADAIAADALAGAQTRPANPVVRAGSSARLLLEGAHVHISLTVICLQSGAAGQTIRAASLDRRQTYTAQVVREGILEGRL